jgi:hypothetical protein
MCVKRVVPILIVLLFACERAAPPRVLRTAELQILVGDTLAAVDGVTKTAEAAGGYVATSTIWRDGDALHAKVTLRVPPDKLTSTLSSFRGMATRVEHETISVSSPKHERACGVL